ncbi:MAG: LON peptidase substrate-binding domain-containing protein [Halothiobacillaceae bacterium]
MNDQEIPLFPLHAVLYPGGNLSLRIFEVRYIDMVRRCLREDRPFGVVLIDEGSEVEAGVTTHPVGTTARIVDSGLRSDGLLGIFTRGEQRFRIDDLRTHGDGLAVARVQMLDHKPRINVALASYRQLLESLIESDPARFPAHARRMDDPVWVIYRLSENLPIPLGERQRILEAECLDTGLAAIDAALARIGFPPVN